MAPSGSAAQAPSKNQKGPTKQKQRKKKNPPKKKSAPVQHSPRQLAQLPTEILILICRAVFEQVRGDRTIPDHPRDLIRLARTCKALHHAAQDVLYRNIIAGFRYHGTEELACGINLADLVCELFSALLTLLYELPSMG